METSKTMVDPETTNRPTDVPAVYIAAQFHVLSDVARSENLAVDHEVDLDGSDDSSTHTQQPTGHREYLVPWATLLEINPDDIRSNAGRKASSRAPSTVVLEDRGDSDHLSRNLGRSSTFGLTLSDQGHESVTSDTQQGSDNAAHQKPLEQRLRAALVTSASRPHERFLPLDALDRIITFDTVRHELEQNNIESPSELARKICGVRNLSETSMTSRRKLFAIMVLIDKVCDIPKLVEEQLFDCDLPFEKDDSNEGSPVLAAKGHHGDLRRLRFCENWRTVNHENFFDAQWKINAPYLLLSPQKSLDHGPRTGKRHLVLNQNDILPIISCESISHGDFGDVYKVQFHPSHYSLITSNGPSGSDSNRFFALKSVRGADIFQTEWKSLQRVTYKRSPHLIKLLCSIEHGPQNHLILPYAHGNLHKLWETMPEDPKAARDVTLGRWLASQILGLARSLKDIHNCKLDQAPQSMRPSEANRKYGVHGDIKPANILWFLHYMLDTPTKGLGLLQITDFGLSDFKGSGAPEAFTAKGITPQYRPPEYEEHDNRVSQKSDVWAFACVLIEFLTWYLCGLSTLKDFEEARKRQSYPGVMDKAYFELKVHGGRPVKATQHDVVMKHLAKLSSLPYCPDFALDLIHQIKKHLLRIDPDNREAMNEFVPELERWHTRCAKDEAYVTESERTPITNDERTNSDQSDKSTYAYGLRVNREFGLIDGVVSTPQIHLPVSETVPISDTIRRHRSVSGSRSGRTLRAPSAHSTDSIQIVPEDYSGCITATTSSDREAHEGQPLLSKQIDSTTTRDDVQHPQLQRPSRAYCGLLQGFARISRYLFPRGH